LNSGSSFRDGSNSFGRLSLPALIQIKNGSHGATIPTSRSLSGLRYRLVLTGNLRSQKRWRFVPNRTLLSLVVAICEERAQIGGIKLFVLGFRKIGLHIGQVVITPSRFVVA
jgi:hypothetical protein